MNTNRPDYAAARAAEIDRYANCLEVHDLPAAFHYWSNRHLAPKLAPFGFSSPRDFFADVLRRQSERQPEARFLSIGAGNCDLEIGLADELRRQGHRNFTIECLDLNAGMLTRGSVAAAAAGVSENILTVEADFNSWSAGSARFDAVLANQSLHHVVNLEGLLDEIRWALVPGGVFAVSDMIGRNGHQRWPEALAIVRELWRKLPPSYRVNLKLDRYEETFLDWDCSGEGFEGVRSEEILPLLLDRFHFRFFLPFGNLIDPFIDRAFGGHFDVAQEWDRRFLDDVQKRDEQELEAGRLTPTHLIAAMCVDDDGEVIPPSEIRRHVRPRDAAPAPIPVTTTDPYAWGAWPHRSERELALACERLARSANTDLLWQRTAWARSLEAELEGCRLQAARLQALIESRTEWARELERESAERAAWGLDLEQQLEMRTAWAQSLEREVTEGRALIARLQQELAERTAWAQGLDAECAGLTQRARALEAELRHRSQPSAPGWAARCARMISGLLERFRPA